MLGNNTVVQLCKRRFCVAVSVSVSLKPIEKALLSNAAMERNYFIPKSAKMFEKPLKLNASEKGFKENSLRI